MSTPQAVIDTTELEELRKSFGSRIFDLCRKQPLAVGGAIIVVLMLFLAAFASYISPYDPEINNFEDMLQSPNRDYWMGTDQFGRDILTRIIYGAQTALFVGFTAAFVGATGGLVLGVASAYFGGLFDLIVQRIVDVVMAFPLIILALAVVASLGPGTENVSHRDYRTVHPPVLPCRSLQRARHS